MTILAPGLLGASLALALRQRQLARRLHVWARREATRQECAARGWFDAVFAEVGAACAGADLVVVCAPVAAIPELALQALDVVGAGGLVTDVGSTKAQICAAIQAGHRGAGTFVGSHPMAGSEKAGLAWAEAELFARRACLVTPLPETPPEAIARVRALWEGVGMRVWEVSPAEHDAATARLSHLPHLVASAVAAELGQAPAHWLDWAGQGLRDTTRIASGDPDLWLDIVRDNRPEIAQALTALRERLAVLQAALDAPDESAVRALLVAGKRLRDRL